MDLCSETVKEAQVLFSIHKEKTRGFLEIRLVGLKSRIDTIQMERIFYTPKDFLPTLAIDFPVSYYKNQ